MCVGMLCILVMVWVVLWRCGIVLLLFFSLISYLLVFVVNHGTLTRFSIVLFVLHVLYFSMSHMGFCLTTLARFHLPIAVAGGGLRGEIVHCQLNFYQVP